MTIKLVTRSIWKNPGNYRKRVRKSFDAVGWQLQKRIIRSPRVLMLPNGVLFKAYPDCVVSSSLIYADWPEYQELTFLRQHLKANDVVIDVGANVGHILLLLADIAGPLNIYGFEPTPISFKRLEENWHLNNWTTEKLFQVAVGAKAGSVSIRDVDKPLTTNAVASVMGDGRFVEVPLVCLDDLRHLWENQRIGLLKIDVEGYEVEVFRGSKHLLKEDRPCFIMFESLSGALDQRIASLLADFEYVVFQLDSGGHPDFKRDSAQNLFAIPKEHQDRFNS